MITSGANMANTVLFIQDLLPVCFSLAHLQYLSSHQNSSAQAGYKRHHFKEWVGWLMLNKCMCPSILYCCLPGTWCCMNLQGFVVTAYIVACINCRRRQYMLHELSSAYIVVRINCCWQQYIPVSVIMARTDATLFYKADDHIYMYLR